LRFAFTREQLLFRDSVRDVLRRECTPDLVRASWENGRAGDLLWKTLAELGVVGLTVPEEHGGLDLGALDWVLLLEEGGRFAAPIALGETIAVAVPLIAEAASEDFKRKWLGPIGRGEARVAIGLRPSPLVREADVADLVLLAQDDVIHAVPGADVTLEPLATVDPSRRLSRVTRSANAPIEVFGGRASLAAAFDRAVLAASAELLGLGAQMIAMTVDYAKVRKQFGAPIGSFQAVKHQLATAHMRIELARPAVYRAAHSVAHADREASAHVSIAKACASDAATLAARVSLQCHGAIGYSFEHDLHLWMKRAWALAAAWGDAAWHRERVARAVIDHVSGAETRSEKADHTVQAGGHNP
jgi:alkylation response protein AidB-like acyl-CoA dehydrogenase